ncbi:MAG: hypothetical protein GPOALKHO_001927 [Sodalis sp.]|nr:MAG: hypothetical protein GPOALKHO_001927 [Sodalis sp.]
MNGETPNGIQISNVKGNTALLGYQDSSFHGMAPAKLAAPYPGKILPPIPYYSPRPKCCTWPIMAWSKHPESACR